MKYDAKSADHTDLIHQGWRVFVGAPRAPYGHFSETTSPKHWRMTMQLSATEF